MKTPRRQSLVDHKRGERRNATVITDGRHCGRFGSRRSRRRRRQRVEREFLCREATARASFLEVRDGGRVGSPAVVVQRDPTRRAHGASGLVATPSLHADPGRRRTRVSDRDGVRIAGSSNAGRLRSLRRVVPNFVTNNRDFAGAAVRLARYASASDTTEGRTR